MTQTNKVNKILLKSYSLLFRIIIILICLIGILAPTENSFWGQFWFFTLQTNFFVIILMLFKIIFQIISFFNVNFNINKHIWFNYLKIAITFYITITGVIFCFVLAPVALATNNAFISSLSYRDIFLHIFVPCLVIIEYYACEEKIFLSKKCALLFLIYPIIYVFTIFSRAALGGKAFPGGSPYPYFFIDPTFNNQGWIMVGFYSILFLLSFYFLGLLYIFINNKLIKKQPNKN